MSNAMIAHLAISKLERMALNGIGITKDMIAEELASLDHTEVTQELIDEIFNWLIELG